jgi:hypothetical protein
MEVREANSIGTITEGLASDYAWLRKATLTNLSTGNGNSISITYIISIPQHEVIAWTDFILRIDDNQHDTRLVKFQSHFTKR